MENVVKIDGVELRLTCGGCPEQYDAYLDGEKVGYLRLRHGFFSVEVPDCGGDCVYEAMPEGDGIFADGEREAFLTKAVWAIRNTIGAGEPLDAESQPV